jgi:hypothetical protein
MGDGWLACFRVGWKDRHALTVTRIASDIALNATSILCEIAPY